MPFISDTNKHKFKRVKDNILLKGDFDKTSFSGVEIKKYLLKRKILKHLYIEQSLSTPKICRKTNLSAPTVISLLNELIDEEIVIDNGTGSSSGGRKPNLYGLNSDKLYFLAIDIRNFHTKIGIFNIFHENVTDILRVEIKLENKIAVLDYILEKAQELLKNSSIKKEYLISVGLSIPGLVSSEKGVNYTYFEIEGGLKNYIESVLHRPVVIENDARVRTLGEYKFGTAKGFNNVLVIDIDWGVGLGMILNKKLYKGKSGFAGEFSHINIVEDGLLCACGKRGCLETVASAGALTNLAVAELKSGKPSLLSKMVNNNFDELNAELIIEAAIKGDQFAIGLFNQVGNKLGKGIAILVHLFNPEKIIIGGRLSKAGDYILAPIRLALNKFCISKVKEDTIVEISNIRGDSGIIGAAALVMESIFNTKTL